MDNPIVKYDQSVYNAKITEMENYVGLLKDHLITLENLKSQVKTFWDDPQAPEFLKRLTTAIVSVRNSMNNTTQLLGVYKSTVSEMDKVTAVTTDIVGDIASIIGGLGISE